MIAINTSINNNNKIIIHAVIHCAISL